MEITKVPTWTWNVLFQCECVDHQMSLLGTQGTPTAISPVDPSLGQNNRTCRPRHGNKASQARDTPVRGSKTTRHMRRAFWISTAVKYARRKGQEKDIENLSDRWPAAAFASWIRMLRGPLESTCSLLIGHWRQDGRLQRRWSSAASNGRTPQGQWCCGGEPLTERAVAVATRVAVTSKLRPVLRTSHDLMNWWTDHERNKAPFSSRTAGPSSWLNAWTGS